MAFKWDRASRAALETMTLRNRDDDGNTPAILADPVHTASIVDSFLKSKIRKL